MLIVILCACTLLTTAVHADQSPTLITDGLVVRRIVHKFDFDERKLGNYDQMPRYWYRIEESGFPNYTNIGFDNAFSTSDEHSLKLQLNGKSAGIRLGVGVIAAIPGADYFITTNIRTKAANHARAVVIAYFCDDKLREIQGSRAHSDLIAGNGHWTPTNLKLRGQFDSAAWLVLELLFLQPEKQVNLLDHADNSTKQRHHIYLEDIKAAAWFDDVTIYQLPRIEITSQSDINLIRLPGQPQLTATVRDLTDETLSAIINVYDDSSKLIDHMKLPASTTSVPTWNWRPNLPRLGWYWAELLVYSDLGLVGRRVMAFNSMPSVTSRGKAEARRFVIIADNLRDDQRGFLIPILKQVGSGAVVIPVWSGNMTDVDLAQRTLKYDPLIKQLLNDGYQLTLSLSQVPAAMAEEARTDADTLLDFFSKDQKYWVDQLHALLNRYGSAVHRWQIGQSSSTEAFTRYDLAALYPMLYQQFAQYVPGPILTIPWSVEHHFQGDATRLTNLMVSVPTSVQPAQIPAYISQFTANNTTVTLNLRTLTPQLYDHHQRADDLAIRMVYAWTANPAGLAIEQPWTTPDHSKPVVMPDPLLAVWSNVASHLAERRAIGEMTLAKGVRCIILEGATGGVLAVWNETATNEDSMLDIYLGGKPVAVDIWGNVIDIPLVNGKHHLHLTSSPIFIENIDVKLSRLRASFTITPDFVESANKIHKHTLKLTNPWPRSLGGQFRLVPPPKWRINPPIIKFSMLAGQTVEFPVEIKFPISELAGEKIITAHMEFDVDRHFDVNFEVPIRVGLKDIYFHPSISLEHTGNGQTDIIITTLITNTGTDDRSLYVFAMAKDQQTRQRLVMALRPSESIVKRFRFSNLTDVLAGTKIRIGLREMDGAAMLSDLLPVPDSVQ